MADGQLLHFGRGPGGRGRVKACHAHHGKRAGIRAAPLNPNGPVARTFCLSLPARHRGVLHALRRKALLVFALRSKAWERRYQQIPDNTFPKTLFKDRPFARSDSGGTFAGDVVAASPLATWVSSMTSNPSTHLGGVLAPEADPLRMPPSIGHRAQTAPGGGVQAA